MYASKIEFCSKDDQRGQKPWETSKSWLEQALKGFEGIWRASDFVTWRAAIAAIIGLQ